MAFSDAALIARVLDRDDRNAFGELVRRYQSKVRSMLRRLTCGDEALSDDLAQETFLRAYRGLRTFRGGAKLSSWLYRIGYNVFVSHKRKKQPMPHEQPEQLAPNRDPGVGSRSLFRHDFERALAVLSSPERTAIALAYGQQATYEDVAEILECPLGTVKTHISRAKAKLQKELGAWQQRGSL